MTILLRVGGGVQGPLASDAAGPVGKNIRAVGLKVVAKNPVGHTKDDVLRVDVGVIGQPDAGRDSEHPQVTLSASEAIVRKLLTEGAVTAVTDEYAMVLERDPHWRSLVVRRGHVSGSLAESDRARWGVVEHIPGERTCVIPRVVACKTESPCTWVRCSREPKGPGTNRRYHHLVPP